MSRILICEDYLDLLDFFSILLKSHGFKTVSVSSKKEIMFHLDSFTPDLILLDVMLRDDDGREICKEIKATNKNIPIILLSANHKLLANYKEWEADDIIEKPFNIEYALNKIKNLIPVK